MKNMAKKLQLDVEVDSPKISFKQQKFTWILDMGKFKLTQYADYANIRIRNI